LYLFMKKSLKSQTIGSFELEIWKLTFDLVQGGEPVEPFVICYFVLEIL